jgi:hypothetical protein
MSNVFSKSITQRHKTIFDSLSLLKKCIEANRTTTGEEITVNYIKGWLHTDLTYLENIFKDDHKIAPRVYKEDPP